MIRLPVYPYFLQTMPQLVMLCSPLQLAAYDSSVPHLQDNDGKREVLLYGEAEAFIMARCPLKFRHYDASTLSAWRLPLPKKAPWSGCGSTHW